MSTRSNIGIIHSNGTIEVVYCHFDGYPSHNGKILLNSYSDINKVKKLISNGGMSSLEDDVKDITFYIARGEVLEISNYSSLKDYLSSIGFDIEYFYLFDENENKWFMNKNRRSGIKELTEEDTKED